MFNYRLLTFCSKLYCLPVFKIQLCSVIILFIFPVSHDCIARLKDLALAAQKLLKDFKISKVQDMCIICVQYFDHLPAFS